MTARKLTKKRIILLTTTAVLLMPLSLLGYAFCWSYCYSQPGLPDKVIDLRTSPTQRPRYLTFCAGLADNSFGYPGHAYVVWSEKADADPLSDDADAVGYIPKQYNDQFLSPFMVVPGMLHFNAAYCNQRNLESLKVIVDQNTYTRTLFARLNWDTRPFRANEHDCLSFATYIARATGLKVPEQRCLYPQDQVRALKTINQSMERQGITVMHNTETAK